MQDTAKRGLYSGPGLFFCFEHSLDDLRQSLRIIEESFEAIGKAYKEGDILKYLECPVRQSSFHRLV